jgi:hypothetical protein
MGSERHYPPLRLLLANSNECELLLRGEQTFARGFPLQFFQSNIFQESLRATKAG